MFFFFFFFNDTATTEIYTLSLHDALPIYRSDRHREDGRVVLSDERQSAVPDDELPLDLFRKPRSPLEDRKSTRLNSSHGYISYAVFCLKKKKKTTYRMRTTQQLNS